MTFTTQIKDEITKVLDNNFDNLISLGAYLYLNSDLINNKLMIYTENASIARWLFKSIKQHYNISINLTIRVIKRFKKRNIYILSLKDKLDIINRDINNIIANLKESSTEEKVAFLKGTFLSCGSINDPKKNQYHLEFLIKNKSIATLVNDILLDLEFNSKILVRDKEYMIYIKSSENISDFIKYLGAFNALFYYEDIRIYKDHKNMVNRLNNCEQANLEKSLKTSQIVIDNINYLEKNNLIDLLDDKTKTIINYKKKYPETSLNELAQIVSIETGNPITKSGINHHIRKINELVKRHLN